MIGTNKTRLCLEKRKGNQAMRVTTILLMVVAILGVVILAGCGAQGHGKGPDLPYAPQAGEALPQVLMKTSMGDIEIELYEDDCPNAVANFISLAEKGFYKGLLFHRIIPDFCVQGGDPKGDGSGGPGYMLAPEFYEGHKKNDYGTIALAKPGNTTDQSGSQFFFNVNKKGNAQLDGKHVVIGKVTRGMDVVEKMAKVKRFGDLKPEEKKKSPGKAADRPIDPPKILEIEVLKKRDHPYDVVNKIPEKDAAKRGGVSGLPPQFNRPNVVTETVPIPVQKKKVDVKTDDKAKTEEKKEADKPEVKPDAKPVDVKSEAKKDAKPEPVEKKVQVPVEDPKKAE